MQGFRSNYLWIVMGIIALMIIGLLIWLQPQPVNSSISAISSDTSDQHIHLPPTDSSTSTTTSFHSPSQSDTQINCQLNFDQSGKLKVNQLTKDCFEYFLTQYGEKNIAQIDQDFKRYVQQSYPKTAVIQIQDLWTRYLKYREKLAVVTPPTLKQDDPAYYRSVFESIQSIRQSFFSTTEIEGLFGTEDIYNQYTLERMAILNQPRLNEIEKAKQLKALFDQLPQDWKANLEQLSKLDDLRQLTASIKKNGGSAQQLHDMRTNLVGAEATARLEQLDLERSNWKNNVTQYLSERQTILNSNMSDTAKQSAIDSLRNQAFVTPQDQIRVHAFESAKDQGQNLPFSE